MGDIDLAARVLAQFETRLSGDINAAEAAMASGSSAETTRLLHSLRGASANVSADALANVAAEIERLIKAADLAAAGSAMAQLRSEANRCLADLPTARAAIARQPSNA
jgi:HPt (histidine-containing phosphotransfer) domain-containing protein